MSDDLLDEATRLANEGAYDTADTLRALVERVQQAEADADGYKTGEGLANGVAERWARRCMKAREERDEARAKLDKVRALAVQWSEEAGDYVPPLPADEPYNLMVNHSRGVLAILDGEPG